MRTPLIAFAFSLFAAPIAAQDFYAGFGYDFAMPHSGANQNIASAFAGARFGQGPVTYGAELDYGLGLGGATDHDSLRLRGIVHNDAGNFGFFGTLGVTQYYLDAGGNAEGFNYGLGADYNVTEGTAIRLEMIRDDMLNYGSDVTTVRVGVAFNF